MRPTSVPRRFAVIGGGPAGLEVSRRLALAGHQVTLLEREQELGGALQYAARVDEPMRDMVEWLRREMARAGVDVRVGVTADASLVADLSPDEVVVAVGAVRDAFGLRPNMPNLRVGESAITWALGSESLDGIRVAVIDATLEGLVLAKAVAERGARVSVIGDDAPVGAGWASIRRDVALTELRTLGVEVVTGATGVEVDGDRVGYVNARGQTRRLGTDMVLAARSVARESALVDQFTELGIPVSVIGDAAEVGYLDRALQSAAEFASSR